MATYKLLNTKINNQRGEHTMIDKIKYKGRIYKAVDSAPVTRKIRYNGRVYKLADGTLSQNWIDKYMLLQEIPMSLQSAAMSFNLNEKQSRRDFLRSVEELRKKLISIINNNPEYDDDNKKSNIEFLNSVFEESIGGFY